MKEINTGQPSAVQSARKCTPIIAVHSFGILVGKRFWNFSMTQVSLAISSGMELRSEGTSVTSRQAGPRTKTKSGPRDSGFFIGFWTQVWGSQALSKIAGKCLGPTSSSVSISVLHRREEEQA